MRIRTEDKCFPALQEGLPVQHDQTAAGVAADPDICPGPQDSPFISTAWMRLAGANHIAGKYQLYHITFLLSIIIPENRFPDKRL
jgi:hypothetical protein